MPKEKKEDLHQKRREMYAQRRASKSDIIQLGDPSLFCLDQVSVSGSDVEFMNNNNNYDLLR